MLYGVQHECLEMKSDPLSQGWNPHPSALVISSLGQSATEPIWPSGKALGW